MTLIKGKNLTLTYKGNTSPSLNDVNFSIEEGSITLFLGKSGSGKTSLLKCLANLNTAYSGSLEYRGKSIKELSSQARIGAISYVAQHFNLFSHFTVLQNCVHPQIKVLTRSKEEAEEKALAALTKLGVGGCKEKRAHHLSGGQQQRVALARALCMDSKVLLLDEPTSALDPQTTRELQEILLTLQSEGITIILITHDMPFAKGFTDMIYYMDEGRIVDVHSNKQLPLKEESAIFQFINT